MDKKKLILRIWENANDNIYKAASEAFIRGNTIDYLKEQIDYELNDKIKEFSNENDFYNQSLSIIENYDEFDYDEIIYTDNSFNYLRENKITDFEEAVESGYTEITSIANFYYAQEQDQMFNQIKDSCLKSINHILNNSQNKNSTLDSNANDFLELYEKNFSEIDSGSWDDCSYYYDEVCEDCGYKSKDYADKYNLTIEEFDYFDDYDGFRWFETKDGCVCELCYRTKYLNEEKACNKQGDKKRG